MPSSDSFYVLLPSLTAPPRLPQTCGPLSLAPRAPHLLPTCSVVLVQPPRAPVTFFAFLLPPHTPTLIYSLSSFPVTSPTPLTAPPHPAPSGRRLFLVTTDLFAPLPCSGSTTLSSFSSLHPLCLMRSDTAVHSFFLLPLTALVSVSHAHASTHLLYTLLLCLSTIGVYLHDEPFVYIHSPAPPTRVVSRGLHFHLQFT